MIDAKIFNDEVNNFLKHENDQSKVLIFKSANIRNLSYIDFLDWFAFDLGFMFFNIEVVDEKDEEKTLGFFPELRYYNNNVFGEKVKDYKLSEEWQDLKSSSTKLARETISKIFSFNDLEKFISKKNYS